MISYALVGFGWSYPTWELIIYFNISWARCSPRIGQLRSPPRRSSSRRRSRSSPARSGTASPNSATSTRRFVIWQKWQYVLHDFSCIILSLALEHSYLSCLCIQTHQLPWKMARLFKVASTWFLLMYLNLSRLKSLGLPSVLSLIATFSMRMIPSSFLWWSCLVQRYKRDFQYWKYWPNPK